MSGQHDSQQDLYAPEAEAQLDELQAGEDAELYNAVLDAIEHVLDNAESARAASPPLRDTKGRPIWATVVMYQRDPRWFVFWSDSHAEPVIRGIGALPEL